MHTIADLHIHGRYSRACSKDLSVATLTHYAKQKGIHLLGTGDFTHPIWIQELNNNLVENDRGLLQTKQGYHFMWTTEISLVYTQDKGRRVHLVVFAPNGEVVQQITDYLKTKGRVDYDGRPIFNIPCPEFTEALKEIDESIEIIPAHAWTPWFSVFGSKSGFDSLKECFLDQTRHIYAIETGLSSDPPMNWRIKELDDYNLVSFSDSHSYWPWRIGREATIFDGDVNEMTYKKIIQGIRTKKGLLSTIEVDPSYGKYHIDGHRACGIVFEPEETKKHNGICPKCNRPLTLGVLGRVQELADREEGYIPKNHIPYTKLLPLHEVISSVIGGAVTTKKVNSVYESLMKNHNEFQVLMNLPYEKLASLSTPTIAQAIVNVRQDKITIEAGYDGVYGKVHFEQQKKDEPSAANKTDSSQKTLGGF